MDCDRAFMVLTRGPFPSGSSDDLAVQHHIETCPECWRLADALRPAADLFHESVPLLEVRTLPGYWADAAWPQRAKFNQREPRPQAGPATAVSVAPKRRLAEAPRKQLPLVKAIELEPVGWREVLALLTVAIGTAGFALAVAWLWQSQFMVG